MELPFNVLFLEKMRHVTQVVCDATSATAKDFHIYTFPGKRIAGDFKFITTYFLNMPTEISSSGVESGQSSGQCKMYLLTNVLAIVSVKTVY